MPFKIIKNHTFILSFDKSFIKLYNTTHKVVFIIKYSGFLDFLFKMSAFTRFLENSIISEDGVTLRQFYILDIVNKANSVELTELHSILKVEKSTTTRLIAPLLNMALIKKEKSTKNQRSFIISLTEKGKELHNTTSECINEFIIELTSEHNIDSSDFFRLAETVVKEVEKKECCK